MTEITLIVTTYVTPANACFAWFNSLQVSLGKTKNLRVMKKPKVGVRLALGSSLTPITSSKSMWPELRVFLRVLWFSTLSTPKIDALLIASGWGLCSRSAMDCTAVARRAFHNPVEPRYLLYSTRTNSLTSLFFFYFTSCNVYELFV